ncbi:MAG TPA: type II secretion system protein [Longimicrobium sp.]|nr:type II secretion system protein [Longimicrobium sp.]
MRRPDLRRGRGGFTLLESLVALVILGVALTPLLSAVTDGVRAQGRLGAAHEAVSLAEAKMAELALMPVDSIPRYLQPRSGWFAAPFAGYRWRALLRPEPASPALVRGAVLVEWKDGSYSLETIFHRPEMLPDFAPVR